MHRQEEAMRSFHDSREAPVAVPFIACMAAAAAFYHLPPRVLPSIQAVEGGAIGSIHHNTDGSDDFGLMQVNTRWVLPLAQVAGLASEDVRARLIGDGCFNIAAAALILRAELNEARGDMMRAIGNYHSHTPGLNAQYQEQVLRSATRLFVAPVKAAAPDRSVSRAGGG
jgi:hypothetical protein